MSEDVAWVCTVRCRTVVIAVMYISASHTEDSEIKLGGRYSHGIFVVLGSNSS